MKAIAVKDLEEFIDILLYLHKKGKVDLLTIQKECNIDTYLRLHRYFKNLEVEGIVDKLIREKIIMGEPKYDYQLSQKGLKLLKDISKNIDKALKILPFSE